MPKVPVMMRVSYGIFLSPDLSLPLDCFAWWTLVALCPLLALSNVLTIPGFNKSGALMSYSKFAHGVKARPLLSSRVGMILLYLPSACLAYAMHDPTSLRSRAVACLAVLHFSKRTLECICLHEYSGTMPLFSSLMISSFYLLVAGFSVHYASVVPAALLQDWTLAAGLLLFCVGQLGNLCHHYLLATLRRPGERVYKVPRGGLFEYVAAPHYLFELVAWAGTALVGQHLIHLGILLDMTVYLRDRAQRQTEWNRAKLDGYPRSRKHLIPFIH